MKKQLIVLLICLVVSATLCLSVSRPAGAPPILPIFGGLNTDTQPSTSSSSTHPSTTSAPLPIIRLYICQREEAALYEAMAALYTQQTGIDCQVITGDLAALMESDTPPSIFCLHSQEDALLWQEQLYDLSGQEVLQQLYHPNFALSQDGKALALAMDVTAYGIVYNAALLAQVGYTREDIADLSDFRQKVEAITAEKLRLGFSAFCTPDLTSTRLVALLADCTQDPAALRALLDLMRANQSVGDALTQFNAGKTVFYIAGAWEYAEFSQPGFHHLDFLPFYTENDGAFPCISSYYWAVNGQADEEDINLALEFMTWMVTAGEDGSVPVDSLGIFAPFRAATSGQDVFYRLLLRKHLANDEIRVCWSIADGMDQTALAALAEAMQAYLAAPNDENWALVEPLLP